MSTLCVDAVMSRQATGSEAEAVMARWRHHPACSAWKGGPCDMGCKP